MVKLDLQVKKILGILASILFVLLFSKDTLAISDPLSVPNNRFGIHIFDEGDLEDAARLVNSTGGDWGYVTFVITEAERNHARWQEVFDKMRRLHLVPIVRLATKVENGVWAKPRQEEINNWLAFLNSLNWVTQNRYIIIGNEPNHAKEWGGELNPQEYAIYLKAFSQKLKEADENFFVLPAGLDASAPNGLDTMDASLYIREMLLAEMDVFEFVDGWNSHSYPNPGFSGSENGSGKGSVRTFDWELSYLRSLGITKDLPVFITETGWIHSAGRIEERFKYAFENVWDDERIVAVTPFILDYNQPPFDSFSWKDTNGNFLPIYETVRTISKEKGTPKQIIKGDIIFSFLEPIGISGYPIKGIIYARNTGQNIWDDTNVNIAQIAGEDLRISNVNIPTLEPSKLGLLLYDAKYPDISGSSNVVIALKIESEEIAPLYQVEITSVHPEENKWGLFWEKITLRIQGVARSLYNLILR